MLDWFQQGCVVYICGSNPACHGVLAALAKIFDTDAEQIQSWRQDRRIVVEFWNDTQRTLEEDLGEERRVIDLANRSAESNFDAIPISATEPAHVDDVADATTNSFIKSEC